MSGADPWQQARDAVLAAVSGGVELEGTLRSLARGLGTSEPLLRACLRGLLEEGHIAVDAGPRGRLTIRQRWRRGPGSSPDTEAR